MNIVEPALVIATEETVRAVHSITGMRINQAQARRVAERAIKAYYSEFVGTQGMKMKPSTREIAALEIGESCVVEATCKQNLHGQFKSIRRTMKDYSLKWRVGQIGDGLWKVYRVGPDADLKKKPAELNKKAVVLSTIGWEPVVLHQYPRPAYFLDDNTKAKARELLGDPTANWTAASVPEGIKVWRKPDRAAIGKRKLQKQRPVWNKTRLEQMEKLIEQGKTVKELAKHFKTSRGAIYTQLRKRKEEHESSNH